MKLVKMVRAMFALFDVLVGGLAVLLVDIEHSIGKRLPLAGLLIVIMTFVLLWLLTGSVVLLVKAIVLNLLSLSATFGVMVYIFQEGYLRSVVGNFTATNTLD